MEIISSVSTSTIPEHPILVPGFLAMDLDDGAIAICQQDCRMILRGTARLDEHCTGPSVYPAIR